MLRAIVRALANRAQPTELYKVRAHADIAGNEAADKGAKLVASGRVPKEELSVPQMEGADGASPDRAGGENRGLTVGGALITKPKPQLRRRVTEWLAGHRQYGYRVGDMWEEVGKGVLDRDASNDALWGTGDGRGAPRVVQTLRARSLELVMLPHSAGRQAGGTANRREVCPLCGEEGNWFHVCSMCRHKDMRDFYTTRHNKIGGVLLRHIRRGKHGRWLTLTSFGTVDGQPEQNVVPEWMIPAEKLRELTQANCGPQSEGPGVRQGTKPDIIILVGWPETAPLPTGPTKQYRSSTGNRRVGLVIGELGCTSDLKPEVTVERKAARYETLIRALGDAGWEVDPELHVITVGVRGTVPTRNHDVLERLGIAARADRRKAQAELARESIRHLNIIVRQFRVLTKGRRTRTGDAGLAGERPHDGERRDTPVDDGRERDGRAPREGVG